MAMPTVVPGVAAAGGGRTPMVVFPGYATTILRVTGRDQTSVKGCSYSGSFQDGIPAQMGTMFGQVCRD
jgi:hypothetical protein